MIYHSYRVNIFCLQVVKSVAAFGFMDLSLDSSEYCQAQHNKLDVNAY